jgi:hypothetical protein
VEGYCEHINEPSGSIKCWEILEWLSDGRLLKKESAPWIWLVGWFSETRYNRFENEGNKTVSFEHLSCAPVFFYSYSVFVLIASGIRRSKRIYNGEASFFAFLTSLQTT